jgi:hypothetical protein
MDKLNENNIVTLLQDFVKISEPEVCPVCKKETKFVGETRTNGGWVCPRCYSYFPYRDFNFKVMVPFTRLTNELEPTVPTPKGSILLGDPDPSFPINTTTQFLVPSYNNYRIKRKRNILLAVMEDFSRTGRDKSGNIYQFDLGWIERPKAEYDALITFANDRAFHLPFNYYDVFLKNTYTCFFDSDVSDAEVISFDNVSFSVRLTQ